jgi:hypothetical protein
MLLRRSPMSFRSLLVMVRSLLMHILSHNVSLLFGASGEQRLMLSIVPTCSGIRWLRGAGACYFVSEILGN